jgi:putative IMPACT (imprinted ancient) family translation regulator
LTDVLIIVARYFGGTLLGVPGLINAYKTAAALALQVTPVLQKPVLVYYRLQFDYTIMNEVMTISKQCDCVVSKQEMNLFCSLKLGIPKNRLEEVLYKLNNIRGVEAEKV